MKHYRPSSELQRAAEEALRNRSRLAAWKARQACHNDTHRRGGLPAGMPRRPREKGLLINSGGHTQ